MTCETDNGADEAVDYDDISDDDYDSDFRDIRRVDEVKSYEEKVFSLISLFLVIVAFW